MLDIVGVLRGEDGYAKIRNYWKYLKTKLKKENDALVSAANQLKITAADGEKYLTDGDGLTNKNEPLRVLKGYTAAGFAERVFPIHVREVGEFITAVMRQAREEPSV